MLIDSIISTANFVSCNVFNYSIYNIVLLSGCYCTDMELIRIRAKQTIRVRVRVRVRGATWWSSLETHVYFIALLYCIFVLYSACWEIYYLLILRTTLFVKQTFNWETSFSKFEIFIWKCKRLDVALPNIYVVIHSSSRALDYTYLHMNTGFRSTFQIPHITYTIYFYNKINMWIF